MEDDRQMAKFTYDAGRASRLGRVSALAVMVAAGALLATPNGLPAFSGAAHAQAIVVGAGPASFSPVVKAVAPAVVHIQVTQRAKAAAGGQSKRQLPPGMEEFFKRFFGDQLPFGDGAPNAPRGDRSGLGSGFFIDADGHIVTNNHVIDGADEMIVTLKDGRKLDAKLIGVDSRTDLALIKVDGDGAFPYVEFGDSDKAEVGDWIVAVGNPFGLDHTVTTGIVSARGRSIGAGPYDDFLQIDAPINKGNSGGPAFNLQGKVVGVNTAIFSPTGGSVGIGFAIPSNLAKGVIEQLKSDGAVARGWLGVGIQGVSEDIAAGVGLDAAEGAIVSSVAPDGPADAAGLKTGDVILEVNGERIEEMPELPRVIADIKPGETAKLSVWRNGKAISVNVELGRLPSEAVLANASPAPALKEDGELGLTFAPLTDEARRAAGVEENTEGVLITSISKDSPLAEKGVQPGAVLLSVAGDAVATPEAAAERIRAAKNDGKAAILLLIRQNKSDRFVAAPLQTG